MSGKIDAVKLQREIRDKLGRKYKANRAKFVKELSDKYGGPAAKGARRAPADSVSK
ncbi:MAG: hypothetical protein ABIH66_03470 [bacterium]